MTKTTTFKIRYTSKITGKSASGNYRYLIREVAEAAAKQLQAKADAIGRPVSIQAVAA